MVWDDETRGPWGDRRPRTVCLKGQRTAHGHHLSNQSESKSPAVVMIDTLIRLIYHPWFDSAMSTEGDYATIRTKASARDQARDVKEELGMTWRGFLLRAAEDLKSGSNS